MQKPSTGSTPAIRAGHWLDLAFFAAFACSLAVVGFVAGAYFAEFDLPAYRRLLEPAMDGLRARHERRYRDWSTDGWYRARQATTGLALYRADRAFYGWTLYSSLGDPCSALLLSMQGEVLYRWHLPFREAWPDHPHVADPVPADHIYWRRMHAFPNGDLLASYSALGDTPGGYGLVKVDRSSRLIWRFSDCAHHDFDFDEAGRVYVLTHRIRREPLPAAPHLKSPMLEDFVVVLDPEGRELARVSLFEAFANSPYRCVLESLPSDGKGDHTHANTVRVVSAAFAGKRGRFSPGDVLVSLRNNDTLAVLNLQRRTVVWAQRGFWSRQHDPDLLANGRILIFDNRGNRGAGGTSRLIEFDPLSTQVHWVYTGSPAQPFESHTRGSQQLLPNGNVLVTEANNGRLFEVTRDGEVVWEYFCPHRRGKHLEFVAVVSDATRYAPPQLPFLLDKQAASAAAAAANRVTFTSHLTGNVP